MLGHGGLGELHVYNSNNYMSLVIIIFHESPLVVSYNSFIIFMKLPWWSELQVSYKSFVIQTTKRNSWKDI